MSITARYQTNAGLYFSFRTRIVLHHQISSSDVQYTLSCFQVINTIPVSRLFPWTYMFTHSSFFECCSKLSLECKKKMATKLEIATPLNTQRSFPDVSLQPVELKNMIRIIINYVNPSVSSSRFHFHHSLCSLQLLLYLGKLNHQG